MLEICLHHRLRGFLWIILFDCKVSEMESHALNETSGVVRGDDALVAHCILFAVEIDTAFGHCRVEAHVSSIQIDLERNRRG